MSVTDVEDLPLIRKSTIALKLNTSVDFINLDLTIGDSHA